MNSSFSAHSRYAEHTARKLGLAFRSMDGADAYLWEITDGRRRAVFSGAAGTPYALNKAHAAALARDKDFCARVLQAAGLPTIPSRLFFVNDEHAGMRSPGRELSDALAYAAAATYPMFCKPASASQGAFAEIIADRDQFARYVERLGAHHYAMLAQAYIEAPEYRVMALNGRALFSYRKLSASLSGDGVSTLAELTGAEETVRARGADGKHYRADDVAADGAVLVLEGAANRAVGGGASAPVTDVPAPMADLALKAAAIVDLGLAAVDLFAMPDGEFLIIEVNSSPAVKTLEDHGRWDLIEAIWTANIAAALQ